MSANGAKQRAMVVPIPWRLALTLDNDLIEHITLPNMKPIRGESRF